MVGETESIKERVATVAQSFWSDLLQPLTNLNKHSRPAACRAPPGAFGHGMHRNWDMGNIVITAGRVQYQRRQNAKMERPSQTSVGEHWDCDCDSVGSFIRSSAIRPDLVPR
jgi:hypothetical protein